MMGWECPKCGGVYAPGVLQCFNCTGRVGTAGSNTISTGPSINGMPVCPHCWGPPSAPAQTGCPPAFHYGTTCNADNGGLS